MLKEKEIRRYGEFRTRRLVLEAWDALEGLKVEGWKVESSVDGGQLTVDSAPTPVSAPPAKPNSPLPTTHAPLPDNPAQPMLSDFGLYKCGECGKLVMGFEKDVHVAEVHQGKSVEWKVMRR